MMLKYNISEETNEVRAILSCNFHGTHRTFVALAKCHPDDFFIEDYGKLLAKRRVLLKFRKAELEYTRELMKQYRPIYERYKELMEIEQGHINKIDELSGN